MQVYIVTPIFVTINESFIFYLALTKYFVKVQSYLLTIDSKGEEKFIQFKLL